jgi:hypothetical protein
MIDRAIRVFAISVVCVGLAGASFSPNTLQPISTHQAATAANPIPLCAPGLPTCPPAPPAPPKH